MSKPPTFTITLTAKELSALYAITVLINRTQAKGWDKKPWQR